jgi:hypothetical protein
MRVRRLAGATAAAALDQLDDAMGRLTRTRPGRDAVRVVLAHR